LAVVIALVVANDSVRAEAPSPPGELAGTFVDAKGTFQARVDGATGAMTYGVPFVLPLARGDAQPALGLGYRSGRGTGEAGESWALSIPAIERAPLWGFPKYADNRVPSDEDRYTYGGRALTFVCQIGGTLGDACPSANLAMGPWPAWATRGYRAYRLQVEGSFERLFLSPDRKHWTVQQRGGVTLEFGKARTRPDLGTAVDLDSSKVFRWNLVRAYDLHGKRNLVVYTWADLAGAGRKHLTHIHYTPPASGWENAALDAFAYHVQLSWEAPSYVQIHYTKMDKRRHFLRLRRVAITSKVWAASGPRELVRAYNLAYYKDRGILAGFSTAPVWNRSYLLSVTEEGRCTPPVTEVAGQIPQATGCPSLPAMTFAYEQAKLELAGSFVRSAVEGAPGVDNGGLKFVGSTALLDVDRNGLPDIVQTWPQNHQQAGFCEDDTSKSCNPSTQSGDCGDDGPCKGFFAAKYNECFNSGDEVKRWYYLTAAAPPPPPLSSEGANPQLVCRASADDVEYFPNASRRAREHIAYVNRGATPSGSVNFQHHCLDAGDGRAFTLSTWLITPVPGAPLGTPLGSPVALFSQWGAEAMGPWGDAFFLWSRAGYRGFTIDSATASATFCANGDSATYPALQWREVAMDVTSTPGSSSRWPRRPAFSVADPALALVDIDGDGYLDRLGTTNGARDRGFEAATIQFTQRISHLESVSGNKGPALVPFSTLSTVGEPSVGRARKVTGPEVVYADINGDGLVDLVSYDAGVDGAFVRPGNGRGHFGCEEAPDPACVTGDPALAGSSIVPGLGRAYRIHVPDADKPWPLLTSTALEVRQSFFHDVTGDGLADLIAFEPKDLDAWSVNDGRLKLWVNVDGHTFRCANPGTHCTVAKLTDPDQPVVALNLLNPLSYRATFADFDGNGSQDFVLLGETAVWHFSFLKVTPAGSSPSAPRPGLLTRIRNGVGADTEIEYRTIQELDLAAQHPLPGSFFAPWISHSPQVVPVVTKVTTRDTTQVITGTSLPPPFGFTRTTTFAYRNPAYDPWERSFQGFRRVRATQLDGHTVETRYWFGACASGTVAAAARGGCSEGSDNHSERALAGLPVRVDRYLDDVDGTLGWLSTTTFIYDAGGSWIHPQGSAADRDVRFARVAETREYLYDTALPVSSPDENAVQPPTSCQPVPQQDARVQLVTQFEVDSEGNATKTIRKGRTSSPDDCAIGGFDLDAQVSETVGPPNRCSTAARPPDGDWACLVTRSTIAEQRPGATFEEKLRELRFLRDTSPLLAVSAGDIRRIDACLRYPYQSAECLDPQPMVPPPASGPALERHALGTDAPPPGAASTIGWRTVAWFDNDEFGNAVRSKGPATTPSQPCTDVSFDPAYRQFPTKVTVYAKTACSGGALASELVFDRGLGTPTSSRESNGALGRIEHDGFGRIANVYAPRADHSPEATELVLSMTHVTAAPAPHVKVSRYVGSDESIDSIEISNGLGEHVLGFDEADLSTDGVGWIARDWTARDTAGRVTTQYRPWFFGGDPYAVALAATAVVPQGSPLSTQYDAFHRMESQYDGNLLTAQYRYRPLELELKDAEQVKSSGPYAGLFTTLAFDGQGRVAKTIARDQASITTTTAQYLGTGEPRAICRFEGTSGGCVNSTPGTYTRTMVWDSFGRLRLNDEPNTHRWVYVYDDAGRLVGTSDARGCGKNIYYDALSRVVAEDFSPCEADQPPHTEPNLVTGDGTEAFYRYDTYEAGQVVQEPNFHDREKYALGGLVAMRDRGSSTRFNYDVRGRVRRETRQIAKPGSPVSVLADRYAANTFRQRTDFDIGDRITVRSTGLERPELLVNGKSEETYGYSPRGAVRNIGSSYGDILADIKLAANGNLLGATYGDAAKTRLDLTYDSRERLGSVHVHRSAPGIWSNPPPGYSTPPSETALLDLVKLRLTLDDVGNPAILEDLSAASWPAGAKPVTRTMQYDGFYRLKQIQYAHAGDDHIPPFLPEALFQNRRPVAQVRGTSRVQQQSFGYDALGNIAGSQDNENLPFDRSLGGIANGRLMPNGSLDGPNQLVDAQGIHAEYDRAGNMTELTVARDDCWVAMPKCSHRFRYDWDEVGQLAHARRWDYPAGAVPGFDPNAPPQWDLAYAYSGGARTRISTTEGGSPEGPHTLDVFATLRITSAPFLAAQQEYLVGVENDVGFVGGVGRVFHDTALPQGNGSAQHVYLNLGDHLGSTALVIEKGSGELVERTTYQAFGALDADFRPERWGSFRAESKFTSKETDIEVGLTYFGARYYQAELGRWVSADPLTIHGLGSDLNPYAYVGGRVMSHVDLFGLQGTDDFGPDVFVRGPKVGSRERDAELAAIRGEAAAEEANARRTAVAEAVRGMVTPNWVKGIQQIVAPPPAKPNRSSKRLSWEGLWAGVLSGLGNTTTILAPILPEPPEDEDVTFVLGEEAMMAAPGAVMAGLGGGLRVPKPRYPKGSFSIIHATRHGYPVDPELGPPPDTKVVRLLHGREYRWARAAGNLMNMLIRLREAARGNNLKETGLQIHEVVPIKFGGSPTDPANKILLHKTKHIGPEGVHQKFWWPLQKWATNE
jgi:RHS repeat-associated protein